MLKRTLISLAVPAMLATGLLAMGGSASAATGDRFECKLRTVDAGNASLAHCRYRDDYVHWIRCENSSRSLEVTEEFNGRRNVLDCPNGYRLRNQAIGI
ncbi:hypothetical protein [Nonomuraea sp. NPDC048826]|uniref:hypothetical protein n=1 Tax=Nonomuraea sp. NPDC048826 TaxID=3364347 RepID=UPI0037100C0B